MMDARPAARAPGLSQKSVCPPVPTSLPAVAKSPSPSLVYAGAGVELVSVSPLGDGYGGERPSTLYITTDLEHWRKVTPPQSLVRTNCGYPGFEDASFINASVGWVTGWNLANDAVTIYRTSNGGRSWTAIPGGYHSENAGASVLVQLLSPTVAYKETLEPTGPGMSLAVTTDAGRTWKVVDSCPRPTKAGYQVPCVMPMSFRDALHGFAAGGIPYFWEPSIGNFFATSNGGSTWVPEHPPMPRTLHACPRSSGGFPPSILCYVGLPVFGNARDGVLSIEVVPGSAAVVAFDVTTDGGSHWRLRAQRSTTEVAPSIYPLKSPLVSMPSNASWWIVGWKDGEVTTQVTSDAGARWRSVTATIPSGEPISLAAVGGSSAFLTIAHENPISGGTERLLVTFNRGRSWTTLKLPA
jgi:hypothetical protein